MRLSLEILDHIFSFLVPCRETLIACSKDPTLSSIVERHLYYHVVVSIGSGPTDPDYAFQPNRLSELVSERPRIIHYVRTLQIQVNEFQWYTSNGFRLWMDFLDEAAKPLLVFPVLECIMLTVSERIHVHHWSSSHAFRAALKDRLNLPTIKEVHLAGGYDFPLSLLDNCQNIKNLTLSGHFKGTDQFSALPQLKSLALDAQYSSSISDWVALRINELRSLKCASAAVKMLPDFLGVCSETLEELDVDFRQSYTSTYTLPTGGTTGLPLFSDIPKNLQQLTIRAAVDLESDRCCVSYLPAAAEAIKFFISSPRLGHLILDINIGLSSLSQINVVDFSPLAVLGAASLSIPRIDLYVFPPALTRAPLLSSLGKYEDVVKSIKEGILIIHSEKVAPEAYLSDPNT